MEIDTVLAELRRSPLGAALIIVQVALTLAIVCNSLAILGEHARHMRRPTGLDESNIFTLVNQWPGQSADFKARIEDDLGALRTQPGIIDAEAGLGFPLRGGGMGDAIALQSTQKVPSAQTAIYTADEHGLAAWGLKLVAGRWFRSEEIGQLVLGSPISPPAIVITRALANTLFPLENALGKRVYLMSFAPQSPTLIVGIVERAESPFAASSWAEPFIENSTFIPYLFVNSANFYVVRAQPGRLKTAMKSAENKLYEVDPSREIALLQPFSATRAQAYRLEHSVDLVLGIVSGLLLAVTAFGIVGLTSYWVTQRRRQIGVRRALGARRLDILSYFHTENLLISVTGAALGIGLGLGANLWLATHLQVTRMSPGVLYTGAVVVVGLGQLAALWPALRAARIPPALAARGI
jgi:putative ABC transport system permease protein